MARLTASRSGSYLLTDLPTRWLEIEIDRKNVGSATENWSPLAKAFQELQFDFLNGVPLAAALTLRLEGRLEEMRLFLRKLWRETAPEKPYSEAAALNLAAELQEKVREAKVEWQRIDRDLAKWFGTEFAAGALAVGPAIAHGAAEWAAAAVVIAGATNLLVAAKNRQEHSEKFPAAFFLRLDRGEFGKGSK